MASVVLYALIQLSQRPEPLGRGQRGTWVWGIPIAAIVAFTIGLAVWSAWHGLLDHAVLPASRHRWQRMRALKGGAQTMRGGPGIDHGIWSPFRSLLLAQALAALLGLVFWILVARLVDAHEIGVAAAAISAQTLLGIVTVLGFGTMLISELPLHGPARQRTLVLRSLLVVALSSLVAGAVAGGGAPAPARQPRRRARRARSAR